VVTRPLTTAQVRWDARLGANTITCSRCAYCLLLGRGDRAALVIAVGELEAAGWRSRGRLAMCSTCVPIARAEAAGRAPATPADPSLSRSILRQYAYRATGETRRWALTLLREWGG